MFKSSPISDNIKINCTDTKFNIDKKHLYTIDKIWIKEKKKRKQ